MINKTLAEIAGQYEGAVDYFMAIGLINDVKAMNVVGAMKLGVALKSKGLNEAIVIEAIEGMEKNADKEESYSVRGILPCPVKMPLFDVIEKSISEDADIELRSASSGISWFKDQHEDIDLMISAGFDFIFDKKIRGKGIYKDYSSKVYAKGLEEMKDPQGEVNFIGAVPAIMVVNTDLLAGREMPTSWKDILKEEFANAISLPVGDFDLFSAILLCIDKMYGTEGVIKLRRSMTKNMHPSEMVAKKSETCINIMPYFFSQMVKWNLEVVWPEEGAISSPILMMAKQEANEKQMKAIELFNSKRVGEILKGGRFPSTHPEVDNELPGKMFWLGWDYIDKNDMTKKIEEVKKVFYGE